MRVLVAVLLLVILQPNLAEAQAKKKVLTEKQDAAGKVADTPDEEIEIKE